MNVKFVISKPLFDRFTFSNKYFISKSTGFHTPSQLVTVRVLRRLARICRTPSLRFRFIVIKKVRYSWRYTFGIVSLVTTGGVHPCKRKRSAFFFQTFRRYIKRNVAKQCTHDYEFLFLRHKATSAMPLMTRSWAKMASLFHRFFVLQQGANNRGF